ncbi:HlyD family efflux transporter periplasmic adaptor subunit [Kaustia mangrovi]|uniref:HlyD family efflux transporter periplasmic adaptor subunit n=1 Tax=Kaustia mangrovi TaxID=2593653 RepID=A0A7S8HDA2_9HYPH|nr:HlyD family efflux transporter periplasmic adaptor subunit [Kaustia mangrovi]QPC44592.1 HlyD family efflux transporter periplasmic adaptor subunit [Kaustia mangrovi]
MVARYKWLIAAALVALAAAGAYYWYTVLASRLPDGIAESNGRIEAEQVDIASKQAGRVIEILVDEGDMVEAGEVVARMQSDEVAAQLRAAEAQLRESRQARREAEATLAQQKSQLDLAEREYERARRLHEQGYATTELLDQQQSRLTTARALVDATQASIDRAEATIAASQATVDRLKTLMDDTVLKAPRSGRVQYRLVQPGEVVAAGARILTILDLGDVYMTIYLPARYAGRLAIGAEARLVLDPIPDYVVPATVSFVAAEAQFTPKAVETADERDNLSFRVKLQVPVEILRKYRDKVKTGVRGLGYVRVDEATEWPSWLAVTLP